MVSNDVTSELSPLNELKYPEPNLFEESPHSKILQILDRLALCLAGYSTQLYPSHLIILGQPFNEIHISLLPASLDDAGLQCEALSYTWGTPENLKEVNWSGHTLEVTQNLHSVLRRLRKMDKDRTFWIDAV
jgi:Heterokaryon incompatibility protein (HET)